MYGNVYFHVAMNSLETFYLLRHAAPELYRWSNNNKVLIIRHFGRVDVHKNISLGEVTVNTKYNEQLHSYFDLPANIVININDYDDVHVDKYIYCNDATMRYMVRHWFAHGLLHRAHDRPAIEHSNGTLCWYYNDRLHREDDKPAIIHSYGDKSYYYRGEYYVPVAQSSARIICYYLIAALLIGQMVMIIKLITMYAIN